MPDHRTKGKRGERKQLFSCFVLLLQNFAQNDQVERIKPRVTTFSVVLLAGGESRRMGRDKATVEFDGQPLWNRQLKMLRALRPEKIFVSARTIPSWLPDDAALLLDDPPSRGPLSGVAKALAAMQTTHLLAFAVDMPFMTRKELNVLYGLAGEGRGVVPVIGLEAEPLAAIYPAESLSDFAAALTGSDFSLQSLIRTLAVTGKVQLWPVPAEHERFFRSVNVPSDLKENSPPEIR
jgi:molybdopterin-guanine dinucleotide biosynthesis protein A